MNTAKIYYDSDGNERSIHYMVKYEPEWAANRIQEGEEAIEKLESQKRDRSGNQGDTELKRWKPKYFWQGPRGSGDNNE